MGKVTLEGPAALALGNQTGLVEVCDASGRRLGYFQPTAQDLHAIYDEVNAQITEEELDRRSRNVREHGGFTTANVLDHLKGL